MQSLKFIKRNEIISFFTNLMVKLYANIVPISLRETSN